MNPSYRWRLTFLFIAFGFLAPAAYSQSSLSGTTFGKSQNSSQDLINSLIPGPEKYGKHEKKSDVDPKTLQSKKSNDATFSGGMNDIGLDWSSTSMGKPHGSQGANSTAGGREPSANRSREAGDSIPGESSSTASDSKAAKQSEATGEKDSKTAKTTEPAEKKSNDAATEAAEKDHKTAAIKSEEKSKEKSDNSAGDR